MVNTDCYIRVQAFHKPIAQLHSAVHIPHVIHQLIGHSHEHYFKERQITCKVPRDTYNHWSLNLSDRWYLVTESWLFDAHWVQIHPPPPSTPRGIGWPPSGCTALCSPQQPGQRRGSWRTQRFPGDQTGPPIIGKKWVSEYTYSIIYMPHRLCVAIFHS